MSIIANNNMFFGEPPRKFFTFAQRRRRVVLTVSVPHVVEWQCDGNISVHVFRSRPVGTQHWPRVGLAVKTAGPPLSHKPRLASGTLKTDGAVCDYRTQSIPLFYSGLAVDFCIRLSIPPHTLGCAKGAQ